MSKTKTTDTLRQWLNNTNATSRELGDATRLHSRFARVRLQLSEVSSGVGVYQYGQTITGSVSGATAVVLSYDAAAHSLLVNRVSGEFVDGNVVKSLIYTMDWPLGYTVGDTVRGSTSGTVAKIFAVSGVTRSLIVYGVAGAGFLSNETITNDDASGVSSVISSYAPGSYTAADRGETVTNGTLSHEVKSANQDAFTAINEIVDGNVLQFYVNGVSFARDEDDTKIIFGARALELIVDDASDLSPGDTVAQAVSAGNYVTGVIDASGIDFLSGGHVIRLIDVQETLGFTFQTTTTSYPGELLIQTSIGYESINTSGVSISSVQYITEDPYLSYVDGDGLHLYGPSNGESKLYVDELSDGSGTYFLDFDNPVYSLFINGGIISQGNELAININGVETNTTIHVRDDAGILYSNTDQSYFFYSAAGATVRAQNLIGTTTVRSGRYYPVAGTTYYLDLDDAATSLTVPGDIRGKNVYMSGDGSDTILYFDTTGFSYLAFDNGGSYYLYSKDGIGGQDLAALYVGGIISEGAILADEIFSNTGVGTYLNFNSTTTSLVTAGSIYGKDLNAVGDGNNVAYVYFNRDPLGDPSDAWARLTWDGDTNDRFAFQYNDPGGVILAGAQMQTLYAATANISSMINLTALTTPPTKVAGRIVVANIAAWEALGNDMGDYPTGQSTAPYYCDGASWHIMI